MKKIMNGYSMVELLISMAITGLVFVIAGTAIHQLSTISGYGNDRLKTGHEMQNAAFWFNRDVREAQAASADNNLILTLPGEQVVSYSLTNNSLERISGNSSMILVQNVGGLNFEIQNGLVTMHLTAMISGRMEDSVQGTYKVHLRSLY